MLGTQKAHPRTELQQYQRLFGGNKVNLKARLQTNMGLTQTACNTIHTLVSSGISTENQHRRNLYEYMPSIDVV